MKGKTLKLISVLLILSSNLIYGQLKYNYNWYFGARAAITFNTNPASVKTDNQMSTYRTSATASDPETGKLLMYTNGTNFWNNKGEQIDSGVPILPAQEVVLIPLKKFKNRFMAITFTGYTIIDMQARNGRGQVIQQVNYTFRTTVNRMTAVKHCMTASYWLITIDGNTFCAYLIHPDGRIDAPVLSYNPNIKISNSLGDFVSSNNGEKLAYTSYTPVNDKYFESQLFNFNKRCGTVGQEFLFLPMKPEWDRPHGITFSPDDRFIYVAYGYLESHIVQYETANPVNNVLVATSPQNFNQIACGPDGRLYITTHIDGIPSNKVDVILYPNVKGGGCGYRHDFMRLSGVTNFEVPNLIINHSGGCIENKGMLVSADSGGCLNTEVSFRVSGDSSGIDSFFWFFADPSKPGLRSAKFNARYFYQAAGTYYPFAVLYTCGIRDTFYFKVNISTPQIIDLGKDSTLCNGDSIMLKTTGIVGSFLWNTGESSKTITVRKASEYILEVDNANCKSRDSIRINYYLPISTLLRDNYFICEEENELVELDAGKGFRQYLWLPTNDTSQWIIVRKQGDYHVVVKDFRGCKGDDKSLVENRCDLRVFIPNAFSPNGDGLNDKLHVDIHNEVNVVLKVYTSWGELVYEGANDWDGTYDGTILPQGVYLLKVEVKGFIDKRNAGRIYSTLLHILR